MNRNLKALGLALIATFAMSAVVVSAARGAVSLTPAEYPAVLTASPIGIQKVVTNTGQELNCTKIEGSATIEEPGVGDTSGTAINAGVSGCTAKIGASTLPATVDMNGCEYKAQGGEATEAEPNDFAGANIEITCPGGVTGPQVTIFASAAKHTANEPLCTITVWSNLASSSGTSANVAGPPNTFTVRATNVVANVTRDGSILCGNPTTATYNGEVTVRAFKDLGTDENGNPIEGSQIGITLSAS